MTTRSAVSSRARRALRDTFGLWPMHEAATRAKLGYRVPALKRFEDNEVARLRPRTQDLPAALVATVMPTYKRPELLQEAVESALCQTIQGQTFTDHVVVVVDDGGGLPALPLDPRLVAVSLSRNTHVLGLVRNVGIRLTRSRFIAFLDDDNTWRADHLESALAALSEGADLVYTAVERRKPDGSVHDVLSTPFDRITFRDSSSYVDANSLVVRRGPDAVFSRIPRVRATLPKEDWEFVHRFAKRHVVTHVSAPTVRYLVNDQSYYTAWKSETGPAE